MPEHLDRQGGGDLARLVAAHAVAQEDQGRLAQVVLARFDAVQQREGILVAGADHAGRRPAGDLQADVVERPAADVQACESARRSRSGLPCPPHQ